MCRLGQAMVLVSVMVVLVSVLVRVLVLGRVLDQGLETALDRVHLGRLGRLGQTEWRLSQNHLHHVAY